MPNLDELTKRVEALEARNVSRVASVRFLAAPVVLNSGSVQAAVPWATADVSAHVPPGAQALIVEFEGDMSGPDAGDVDAHVEMRRSAGGPTVLICRGRASASFDNVAWGVQALVPCLSSAGNVTVDYQIAAPGYEAWSLRLVGYVA